MAQSAKPAEREATPSEKAPAAVEAAGEKYTGPLVSIVPAGESDDGYTFDVYVSRVVDLRGYQVAVEVTGGDSGQLKVEDVRIDPARKDYVFRSLVPFTATDVTGARLAGALLRSDGGSDAETPAYLGSFTFRPSDDAQGLFEVRVRLEKQSLLRDSDGEAIEFRAGPAPEVTIARTIEPVAKTSRDESAAKPR